MASLLGFRQLRQQNKGFTLLELLVVISIIGILIAMGVAAFTVAQKRGRDSKRRGDMKAVQAAFEQYYAQNSTYDATCANMATSDTMPAGLPSDPKPSPHPVYAATCATDSYCWCATLEDAAAGNADGSCGYGSATTHFCVSNLQ